MSVIVNAAERAPEAAGVKVAPKVQLCVGVSTVVPVHVVPEEVKSAMFVPAMDRAVMLRLAFPVFVSVALIAALVVPTFWFPKAILVGLSVTTGAGALTPVPVRGTVCGLPAASSATLTLTLAAPSTVGANCTPTLQFEPAFKTLAPSGQAVPVVGATRANCVGFVPVSVMLVMFIDARPVLDTVTLDVALVVLMVWFPNTMFAGARLATGTVPVPVRGTVCGLPVALSATLTLADRAPVAVGLKVTPTAQLNPAPSELAPSGQAVPLVGAPRLKSPGLVPVRVIPVIFSVAEPLFVRVTLFVALDVPTF